jgi:very-short-patch-repair endonuclease
LQLLQYIPDGIYEGKGLNHKEARRVADAVAQFAKEQLAWQERDEPMLSLGVGTFNLRQQLAIQQLLPQVGVAGYRIDLGVLDDVIPGRFLCGIECDGVAYHASETARDRDRLRQQVLEARGWTIHRVWSTDWFKDRQGQIERLLQLIEETRARARETEAAEREAQERARAEAEALAVAVRGN